MPWTEPARDPHPLPAASAIEGGPASGLLHRLAVLFGVNDEPHIDHYDEAVRRGGSLVHVEARDEAQATAARDALLALGAANIDDRVEEWQQRGWRARLGAVRGGAAQGKTGAAAVITTQAPATPSGSPAVTHRHEVSIGGVRVYGHAATSPFEDHVEAFRADYAARFAGSGHSYEEFESAYRHGHAIAADPHYSGRSWDDIAGDVRGDWEDAIRAARGRRFKKRRPPRVGARDALIAVRAHAGRARRRGAQLCAPDSEASTDNVLRIVPPP